MRPERAYSPAARASDADPSHALDPSRVLVIGCGALARELVAVIDQAGLSNVDLTCLPATLHNRPGGIPAAVKARIRAARPRYERIFIAYADCGTGGLLDAMLAEEGIERLPGAHCYEFFTGSKPFAALTDEDPATFFLTDFLARNFDRLVIVGLGLDRHPELLPTYFGNYRRVVYLAQTDDPGLVAAARRAARRLGLAFELRRTGYGDLAISIAAAAAPRTPGTPAARTPAAPRSLAVGASDAATARGRVPGSVVSLPGRQETGRRASGEPPDSRPRQDIRRGHVQSRRSLPPLQGSGGILPERQPSVERPPSAERQPSVERPPSAERQPSVERPPSAVPTRPVPTRGVPMARPVPGGR